MHVACTDAVDHVSELEIDTSQLLRPLPQSTSRTVPAAQHDTSAAAATASSMRCLALPTAAAGAAKLHNGPGTPLDGPQPSTAMPAQYSIAGNAAPALGANAAGTELAKQDSSRKAAGPPSGCRSCVTPEQAANTMAGDVGPTLPPIAGAAMSAGRDPNAAAPACAPAGILKTSESRPRSSAANAARAPRHVTFVCPSASPAQVSGGARTCTTATQLSCSIVLTQLDGPPPPGAPAPPHTVIEELPARALATHAPGNVDAAAVAETEGLTCTHHNGAGRVSLPPRGSMPGALAGLTELHETACAACCSDQAAGPGSSLPSHHGLGDGNGNAMQADSQDDVVSSAVAGASSMGAPKQQPLVWTYSPPSPANPVSVPPKGKLIAVQ